MKRSGFSRGELLALGSVASVVGALLVPVLAQTADSEALLRARDAARDTLCLSNLKQVSLGMIMYSQDFDDKFPKATLAPKTSEKGLVAYGWADAIWPYLKSNDLLQCPTDKKPAQKDPMKPGYTDYWLNATVSNISTENIKSPVTLIIVGDGDGGSPSSNARYNLKSLPLGWVTAPNSPANRHNGQGIYAFADGHVKKVSPEILLPNRPTLENK